MRVGVDRHLGARVDDELEQPHRRVEPFGTRIDLHGLVEMCRGREHELGIELRLGSPLADDHPPGAVAQHIDAWARECGDHALGHRARLHRQLRVHARHDNIELREQVALLVEATVVEDVDFDAGEDSEWCELLVEPCNDRELLAQPIGRQTVRDAELR